MRYPAVCFFCLRSEIVVPRVISREPGLLRRVALRDAQIEAAQRQPDVRRERNARKARKELTDKRGGHGLRERGSGLEREDAVNAAAEEEGLDRRDSRAREQQPAEEAQAEQEELALIALRLPDIIKPPVID